MADAKLTALTAASALAAADLFYVSQSAASRKATGTQLLALVGTAYVPLAGGTMTGALTIASGTLTASAPALNITQTWNGVGQRFDTFVMDITNTNSANSYPMIIRVGGTEQMYLTKTGDLHAQNLRVLTNTGLIGIGSDVFILRDAAAVLAQRNGANAQTLRVYGTYTDASNYERLSLSTTAGSSVNISAETLGTGGDNLDIVLTPAGTGKVGIGGTPSWKLSVVSTTTACDLAVKDSVGALILTTASGAAYLSTNTANPLIFRTNSAEQMRIGSNGVISFGDVTSSYPALKRSTTTLQVRLGDDSGFGDLSARNLVTAPVAFASLTAAATAGNGARAMITNCSHATFGTAADGGGSTKVPVYSDGSSWLVG